MPKELGINFVIFRDMCRSMESPNERVSKSLLKIVVENKGRGLCERGDFITVNCK